MAVIKKTKKQKPNKHHPNKFRGHFCYVCGEHKANEKFSGKGHANHICRQCQSLPIAERNKMATIRKIYNMAFRYLSKNEIKWLRGKMTDSCPEVRDAALEAYNIMFPSYDQQIEGATELKKPVVFNEMDEDMKARVTEKLADLEETLIIAETERLKLRRFIMADLDELWKIMKKPEVMYAWGSGFKKNETRKWLNSQLARYRNNGYGYFAVILKETDKMIGQAGLMQTEINGEAAVEIGYIFDDTVWGKGYAIEAARACVNLAFRNIGVNKLYATIRPENVASIKLAEKLSMKKTGEVMKTYKEIEMLHDVYVLENTEVYLTPFSLYDYTS